MAADEPATELIATNTNFIPADAGNCPVRQRTREDTISMAENPPNAQLDAFLFGAPEPEPQQAPPVESTPPAEPPKGPPEPPVVEPDDDGDPPEPSPGEPVVPRRALEDERHKRQNYVAQAAKFEAERDMLAKQLEELKKAPAPPV